MHRKHGALPNVKDEPRLQRARIDEAFRGLARNDDSETTRVGLAVLASEHRWLSDGAVPQASVD